MKKYLKAIYQSFGNIKLYHDVIHQWTGNSLTYLVVLAGVISLSLIIQFSVIMNIAAETIFPPIIAQWPDITLQDGKISISAEEPYIIKDKDGTTVLIIDTTSNEAELGKNNAPLMVGKDFILSKNADGDTNKTDLTEFKQKSITLTRDKMEKFLNSARYMPILLLPLLILGQWLILVTMTVGAALLSYIVTAYMPEEYDFETRMRIGIIAITPPFLVNHLAQIITPYSLSLWIILVLWAVLTYVIIIGARAYERKFVAPTKN